MINASAEFPNVGSFALVDVNGILKGVRVVGIAGEGAARIADISFIAIPSASGRKRIPLAALIDATPLAGGEGEELAALDARRRLSAVQKARRDELRRRATLAPVLAAERDRHDRKLERAREEESRRAAGFSGRFAEFHARQAAADAAAQVTA